MGNGSMDGKGSAGALRGAVLWFTGLSGSGKTTLIQAAQRRLALVGRAAYALDGDVLRRDLCSDLGYSDADRRENIRRAACVARILADAGHLVLCGFITPFQESRDAVRALMKGLPFLECYVQCPVAVCASRDPKGLYAKARRGQIRDMSGLDAPFEEPLAPELTVATNVMDVARCVDGIMERLAEAGLVKTPETAAAPEATPVGGTPRDVPAAQGAVAPETLSATAKRPGRDGASRPPRQTEDRMAQTIAYGSPQGFIPGKSLLVFNHIPKCGGSTLAAILNASLGQGIIAAHRGDSPRVLAALQQTNEPTYLTGHFCWGIHERVDPGRPVHYLTLLRNPLGLCKSFYNYQVKRLNTIAPFSVFLRRFYDHNPLTRHLGGGDLAAAKERLEAYYLFGLLERFDASLEMFARFLPLQLRGYDIVNYSGSESLQLEEADTEYFRRRNNQDIALYAWAEELFRRRLTEQGMEGSLRPRPASMPGSGARRTKSVASDAGVALSLRRGEFNEALSALGEDKTRGVDGLTVPRLLGLAGKPEQMVIQTIREWRANRIAGLNLAYALLDYNGLRREKVLDREIAAHRPLATKTPDSVINNYLIECLIMKANVGLMKSGAREQADAFFNEALALNPRHEDLALNIAAYYNTLGDCRTGLQFLKRNGVRMTSANTICQKNIVLGKLHAGLADAKTATRCFAEADRRDFEFRGLTAYLSFLCANNLVRTAAVNAEDAFADLLHSGLKRHPAALPGLVRYFALTGRHDMSNFICDAYLKDGEFADNLLVVSFVFSAYRGETQAAAALIEEYRQSFPRACAVLSGALSAMAGVQGEGDPAVSALLGQLLPRYLMHKRLGSAKQLLHYCIQGEDKALRRQLALLLRDEQNTISEPPKRVARARELAS